MRDVDDVMSRARGLSRFIHDTVPVSCVAVSGLRGVGCVMTWFGVWCGKMHGVV